VLQTQTDPTEKWLLLPAQWSDGRTPQQQERRCQSWKGQGWGRGPEGTGRGRRGAEMGVPVPPGVDPEDALLQVVNGEAVGPAPRARLLVDGAPARAAHGGGLDAGQAGIPVRPEQDPARDSEQGRSARGHGSTKLCLPNWQQGLCPDRSPWSGPPARSQRCHHALVTNVPSGLTHSGGPGQWRGDARCPQPAVWFAWCHPAWPPRSGPGCSPPSRCCQRSSPRPAPRGWPAHTVSPPRSWSELQGTAQPRGLRPVPPP